MNNIIYEEMTNLMTKELNSIMNVLLRFAVCEQLEAVVIRI